MTQVALSERVWADAEPFSAADLHRLRDALDRLLEYENKAWPTREHYTYILQLEHVRHEIAKRIPPP